MNRIAWIAVALFASACAGPSGPDRTEVAGPRLDGEQITVMEFTQDRAQIRYGADHDAMGLAVAEEIAGELRRRGHDAKALPANATPDGDVVVRGRITRIDGGSRAVRYFVGFGAGAAKFGVEGDVERQEERLASFSHERWSGFGVFGGSSSSLVQKCIRAVGRDVGKMIDEGAYTTVE